MKNKGMVILSGLVLLMMACNLVTKPGNTQPAPEISPQASDATPQDGSNQPGGILQPPATPDPQPVNVNEGLASLNSYQMVITITSVGPDPSQSSTMMIESQHSQDNDSYLTRISNISVDETGADSSNSTTEIYQIGYDQCTIDGEDSSWESMPPNQAEMLGLFKSMLGMTPLIEAPTFVAQETINGITSNHFTFQVAGLGSTSGARVNVNQGDYWLAVDGQYIVKYLLILETSMDPTTEVLHEEVAIEMNQVNQPVAIAFPQSCVDASLVTPTP
jgi:hypothetical protein